MDVPQMTNEDLSKIGLVITTFSSLEHELLRAIIAMNGAHENPADAPEGFSERFLVIVKENFRGRISRFCKEYRRVIGEDDFIAEFESGMIDAADVRDQFAHGLWEKLGSGDLKCTFFSRAAIREGYACTEVVFTLDDLDTLAASNIGGGHAIMKRFGTE